MRLFGMTSPSSVICVKVFQAKGLALDFDCKLLILKAVMCKVFHQNGLAALAYARAAILRMSFGSCPQVNYTSYVKRFLFQQGRLPDPALSSLSVGLPRIAVAVAVGFR
jgi:hypothetical protein